MSIEAYIRGLSVSDADSRRGVMAKSAPSVSGSRTLPEKLQAAVDAGSILSFVDGLTEQEKADILFSTQLAQRAANAAFDRFAQAKAWYLKYTEVLEAAGWATEQFAFAAHEQEEGDFQMDKAALTIIAAIATNNQLGAITASISALEKLAASDGAITLFDFHAATEGAGNFQIGAVQKAPNGALAMALGTFYFRSTAQRSKFLFFRWGRNDVNFWMAAKKMTFNPAIYSKIRAAVETKLGSSALDFIKRLDVA